MVGVNPPLYFRGADEVGQSSPPSRGIGEIDPVGELLWYDHCFSVYLTDL